MKFSDTILDYLKRHPGQGFRQRPLARVLGVVDDDYPQFKEAIKHLLDSGRVIKGNRNLVMLAQQSSGRIVGVYRANPRGFGFVEPAEPTTFGDLFVPNGEALDAITGDTVAAEVMRSRRSSQEARGRIVEVLERGHHRFVGRLQRVDRKYLIRPEGNVLHQPIYLPDATSKNTRVGDQVVVELTQYPVNSRTGHSDYLAQGVVVEVLGRHGTAGIDVISVIRRFDLPDEFTKHAAKDARKAIASADFTRLVGREDMRTLTTVTVDPVDARDYDDAITLEPRRDGCCTLGVHIADVSQFVKAGTTLDEEARERGNSVYFPRHVIPMLPEVLSNGVCSLQEGQDRWTKSVFIEYDTDGQVTRTRFSNGLICSNSRLTYRRAQEILDGKTGGAGRDVVQLVQRMNALAKCLQRRRTREGMLRLDLPEVGLVLDDDGRVIDAHPEDNEYTHTIIEMFMVEANEAVARLLDHLNVPFIRRVHPEPKAADQAQFNKLIRILGHRIPRVMSRADMQRLIESVRGTPAAFAVNLALLRSLQQAVYSPANQGHFALASRHYAHFTSPIRRYADLTVHRLLEAYIRHNSIDQNNIPSHADLTDLGRELSYTERRAADAERDIRTGKVLTLLSERIGEDLDGVVTGVTHFGVFVQSVKYLVDGLVSLDHLPDRDWRWHKDSESMRSGHGRRLALGDPVGVRIVSVDLPRRQLNLALVEVRSVGPSSRPKSPDKKAKHAKLQKKQRKKKANVRKPKK